MACRGRRQVLGRGCVDLHSQVLCHKSSLSKYPRRRGSDPKLDHAEDTRQVVCATARIITFISINTDVMNRINMSLTRQINAYN